MMEARPESCGDHSYWLGALTYPESRHLDGAIKADATILGGGFTGLATAYFLKRAEPSMRVVVLEAERVGEGASARSAGFCSTEFGPGSLAASVALFGRDRTRQAHGYLEQAVELVERLVRHNRIDCDYERPGLLKVATTPAFERKLHDEVELAHDLGLKGIEWLDARAVRRQLESPLFTGARWEPRCGLLNPARLLRGMRLVLERMGVEIYEKSPGIGMQRKLGRLFVRTPKGGVLTEKVALTTNAYSESLPQLRRKQIPVYAHVVLSEPLSAEQIDAIGWHRRQGVEDARNLARFFRLTRDNRLLIGGRDVGLAFGRGMADRASADTFLQLERDAAVVFPALKRLRFTHRWGGPISVPVQMVPALGFAGSDRVAYSFGCMGHGIALGHMNGWTLSDLLRGERTERTEVFFVNRRVVSWPPEPFRFALTHAARALLNVGDAWRERGLPDAVAEPPVFLRPRDPRREHERDRIAFRRIGGDP